MREHFFLSHSFFFVFVTLSAKNNKMVTEARTNNYWIANNAIYIQLNAMGEYNYIQGNVANDAYILCYMQGIDGLGYDAGHNYQRWPLSLSPTVFPDNNKRYVYVAIPRARKTDNDIAFVCFPSVKIDIYGKEIIEQENDKGEKELITGEQVGSESYYFIFLQGVISASEEGNGTLVSRDWESRIVTGELASDESLFDNPTTNWWQYDSITDTISFVKTISQAIFDNITAKIANIKKLILGDHELNGVADTDTPNTSTDKIVTPAFLTDFGKTQYLSKINNDTAQGIITFLKGLKVGDTGNYEITADGLARMFAFMTSNFNSGLYGQGASIDKDGAAELDSLFVRKFISTPKFVFNEISVTKAEQWNTNGFGTIASVDTNKRQITLKLEENDYGSLSEGDICRGIYADIDNTYNSDSIEEGAVDDCNFVTHKGFFTTYFYVRRIITAEKGKFVFEYGKRSKTTPDPCSYMDFAQYGSFTDKDRMSSMYFCSRGRSYIEVLDGVKTWEVQVENRVARYGYLGNLRVKRKDGTYIDLKGNGLFAQNNVYFGDNIFRLENISNLDELENIAASYDVTLSQYQSVLTVDDMGNVINGLYTQDDGKTTKQYRISTAVFVRKGSKILLEEDENSEEVTEGHYRLSVVSAECSCEVHNSTVFVTAIKNVKDGVLGSEDDDNFDYDEMRKMTDCMITIVVDCEGKTSKLVQMPIRIQHDSLPFMVCDLTNEHAAVSWHTKHKHYAGLPIQTTVNMFYKNEPYDFAMTTSLPAEVRDYLVVSVSDSGKSKVLTIDKKADFSSDVLPTSFEVGIYCVSDYAGAKYEYTKKLSVSKTSDAVIYEIVPSTNSVKVNSKNEVSPSSVGCEVWATSSDDKRYQVTALLDSYSLSYQKNGGTLYNMQLGVKIDVAPTDKEIAFILKHKENGVEYIDDKEGVPVVADGKDGLMALCSDNMVSIAVDNNGKVLTALNSTLSFRLFAGAKELTVSGISISASPTSNVVTAKVVGNTLKLACSVGTDFGKSDLSFIIKVDSKDVTVAYSSYVAVKVVPNVMGKSIKSVNTYYALNNSATSQPTDSAFTYDTMGDAVIASNADKYLWSADKVTYSDNSTAITGIYLVGKCSELASVTEQYAKTTTADEPKSGWSDTYPTLEVGDYIWSRDKITWKDGDTSYSSAQLVGYIGIDGKGYEYVYYLSSSSSIPAKPSRRVDATLTGGWTDGIPTMDETHGYIFVSCRQGELFAESSQDEWSTPTLYTRLPKSIKAVNTWYGLSSSITDAPSSFGYDSMGDAVIASNADRYLWSADKVTYTDGTSEFTGVYCVAKCSDLASIKEQYGTSSSSSSKPSTWSDTYPTSISKGTYIWTRDEITWKNGYTDHSDAQLAGYIGNDGEKGDTGDDGAGFVKAYKLSTYMPGVRPTITTFSVYKDGSSDDLGNGWSRVVPSIPTSSGGTISNISANRNNVGGTWTAVADGEYNYYKSPTVAASGIATMRIYFTTSKADMTVSVFLKAYSEANYDFILVSNLDSSTLARDSNYFARTSGNGVEIEAQIAVATAGTHFVTVGYAKDFSGDSNGDYGLVRIPSSSASTPLIYGIDGYVEQNYISWGTPYQMTGNQGEQGPQGPQGETGIGLPGERGYTGCVLRTSIWKAGVVYYNQSQEDSNDTKYIDIVYREDSSKNDGWGKYVRKVAYSGQSESSFNSSYWDEFSDVGPIYSPLIIAKNAAINFSQGQQFNLVANNTLFGSFRYVDTDGEFAFWIGGTSGANANTAITRGGKLKSNSGEFENATVSGDLSVALMRYKANVLKDGIVNCSFLYGSGAYKLPEVNDGEFIKIEAVNPMLTRIQLPMILSCNNGVFMKNSGVFGSTTDSFAFYGYCRLIGFRALSKTYWIYDVGTGTVTNQS